jgi:cellulose biosynthesis protein BcsQ
MLTIIRGSRATGKTSVGAALAGKFEKQGHKVILLDEFDGDSAIILHWGMYNEKGIYAPLTRLPFDKNKQLSLFRDYDKVILIFKTDTPGIFYFPSGIAVFNYDFTRDLTNK